VQFPARGHLQGNISNLLNNVLLCHIHTENCSNVTLGETPKMHEKQQIRTEVELEDLIVALESPENNWGMLCTSMRDFAPYAQKYFINVLLTHE